MIPLIEYERQKFHNLVFSTVLSMDANGIPSFADGSQRASREISRRLAERVGIKVQASETRIAGQTAGHSFEECCRSFVDSTFPKLQNLRSGKWSVEKISSRSGVVIARFEQYAHLLQLDQIAADNKILRSALGNSYLISPDVVVTREPESDEEINSLMVVVGDRFSSYASLRKSNNPLPILHACLSCKWTIRSDRSQNARSEALSLLRNRKGRAPHICVITAEPTPSRLASIAMGTGDLDCVYHFALQELIDSVEDFGESEAISMLEMLVEGQRLRDISDLPLDLAI